MVVIYWNILWIFSQHEPIIENIDTKFIMGTGNNIIYKTLRKSFHEFCLIIYPLHCIFLHVILNVASCTLYDFIAYSYLNLSISCSSSSWLMTARNCLSGLGNNCHNFFKWKKRDEKGFFQFSRRNYEINKIMCI